jgi:hypothetical protein
MLQIWLHQRRQQRCRNMLTAYTDAAGRPSPNSWPRSGNIGGQTLTPGLYKWGTTVTIPSNITISGSPEMMYGFSNLRRFNNECCYRVTLQEGGAKASNIFWQVAGKATFGTTSHLRVLFCPWQDNFSNRCFVQRKDFSANGCNPWRKQGGTTTISIKLQ